MEEIDRKEYKIENLKKIKEAIEKLVNAKTEI